jgi:hypothetical protein
MRAAIFRNGEIVVDTLPEQPEPTAISGVTQGRSRRHQGERSADRSAGTRPARKAGRLGRFCSRDRIEGDANSPFLAPNNIAMVAAAAARDVERDLMRYA